MEGEILEFSLFITLLTLAFFWGSLEQKAHYTSLLERERNLPPIPVIAFERHQFHHPVASAGMVYGSVVIGADYFKYILSSLVSLFGGNIAVLESVVERGRREAVIRLKEQARGADFLANLRYETTEISNPAAREAPKVVVLVYATAIYLNKDAVPAHAV